MTDVNQSGIRLLQTLGDHQDTILAMAWSPDGKTIVAACKDGVIKHWRLDDRRLLLEEHNKHTGPVRSIAWATNTVLASASEDKTIVVWDVQTRRTMAQLNDHSAAVTCVAWSPGKELLASGSWDTTVVIWNMRERRRLRKLAHHTGMVNGLAWSPARQRLRLASCSEDHTIRIWDAVTGEQLLVLNGHAEAARAVAWSPDGRTLASCSDDKTIRLWNIDTGQLANELHGHTDAITGLAFGHNGDFLASKSDDGTVRIWRLNTCETVQIISETGKSEQLPAWLSYYASSAPAFDPGAPRLLTIGKRETDIAVHQLDYRTLEHAPPVDGVVHYTNAKVVLLGNSGVGKSGLALRLTNRDFAATISSHGRKVYPFDQQTVVEGSQRLTRETYLWDLAGQPGYRLVHQLYLNETAVAVVVFDAQSEIDPFAGVRYWDRALKQAQRIKSNKTLKMRKILAAARVDRGTIQASDARIGDLLSQLSFDSYVETSAKENLGVQSLRKQVVEAIDWDQLPRVTSTTLFQRIKTFLIDLQNEGWVLDPDDLLYQNFLRENETVSDSAQLFSQFRTCIELLERGNLVRRLSFGNLVLLSPEKLDSYASVIVNAAREEPDGMGSIEEDRVFKMALVMSPEERISDKRQEPLLLIATIEDMLHHEIALRETVREKTFLVFPSELTRERQDLPDPQGKTVSYSFEGAVINVYATLIVRLTHSGVFSRVELWKSAATYRAADSGICGLFLEELGEGQGKITLFFEPAVSAETRQQFETFIENHLRRRAIRETIIRRPIISCSVCGLVITEQMIALFKELGQEAFPCPVCQVSGRATYISLGDPRAGADTELVRAVSKMDRTADVERIRATAAAMLQGKQATDDYDVFLCHDGMDRVLVRQIGEKLKQTGILPWLDEWDAPGRPWQQALTANLAKIKRVALFVGHSERGLWEDRETQLLIQEFVRRQIVIIPILLPDVALVPDLPGSLKGLTWVDFRRQEPDPFEQLVWGITGKQRTVIGQPVVSGGTPGVNEARLLGMLKRLEHHRRTLATYLEQQAITGSVNVRPEVNIGIVEARTFIRQLKAKLRTMNIVVEDAPDDEE